MFSHFAMGVVSVRSIYRLNAVGNRFEWGPKGGIEHQTSEGCLDRQSVYWLQSWIRVMAMAGLRSGACHQDGEGERLKPKGGCPPHLACNIRATPVLMISEPLPV